MITDFGSSFRPIFQIGRYQFNTLFVFGLINDNDFKFKLYNLGECNNSVTEYVIVNKDRRGSIRFNTNELISVNITYRNGIIYLFMNNSLVLNVYHTFNDKNYITEEKPFYLSEVMCAGKLGKNSKGFLGNIQVDFLKNNDKM